MFDKDRTLGFPFVDEVANPVIRLTGTGVETRNSADYYYDNKNRLIDSYSFQYTLSGCGVYEENGVEHLLTPGKAFFSYIPADFRYYCANRTSEWRFFFVLFMGSDVYKYYKKIRDAAGPVLTLSDDDIVLTNGAELYYKACNGFLSNSLLGSAAAFDFLCTLCYSVTSNKEKYSHRVQDILNLLESSYKNLQGINAVADRFGITGSHLTRIFTTEVGSTPIEYLTKVRINRSLAMLVETDMSIDRIATECGFDNGNYYAKVFKKYMNTTPTNYRVSRRL